MEAGSGMSMVQKLSLLRRLEEQMQEKLASAYAGSPPPFTPPPGYISIEDETILL